MAPSETRNGPLFYFKLTFGRSVDPTFFVEAEEMSDSGAKGNQAVSQKEKDGAEKRGRGRPRKQPKEASGSPTPKRPRGRPKGSTSRAASKSKDLCITGVSSLTQKLRK
ncbi:hypothetical protein GJAV_G00171370 [Gymnothorax javanicus]|nr:hypothetical protein GJAV_G00171370 [Gymnothorax javanicus]